MAKRAALGDPTDVHWPQERYSALCNVMCELAARGQQEEALIMRVATAGEVAEVIKEIKSRRINRKKFADRPLRDAEDGAAAPNGKAKGKRKGKRRKGPSARQSEAAATVGTTAEAEPSQQELGV